MSNILYGYIKFLVKKKLYVYKKKLKYFGTSEEEVH